MLCSFIPPACSFEKVPKIKINISEPKSKTICLWISMQISSQSTNQKKKKKHNRWNQHQIRIRGVKITYGYRRTSSKLPLVNDTREKEIPTRFDLFFLFPNSLISLSCSLYELSCQQMRTHNVTSLILTNSYFTKQLKANSDKKKANPYQLKQNPIPIPSLYFKKLKQ